MAVQLKKVAERGLQGAAGGSVFGPVGTAVGGAAGGIEGFLEGLFSSDSSDAQAAAGAAKIAAMHQGAQSIDNYRQTLPAAKLGAMQNELMAYNPTANVLAQMYGGHPAQTTNRMPTMQSLAANFDPHRGGQNLVTMRRPTIGPLPDPNIRMPTPGSLAAGFNPSQSPNGSTLNAGFQNFQNRGMPDPAHWKPGDPPPGPVSYPEQSITTSAPWPGSTSADRSTSDPDPSVPTGPTSLQAGLPMPTSLRFNPRRF